MSRKNHGRKFEHSVEQSCDEQSVFYFRVRDVFLPPEVRKKVRLPKNKYDCLIYSKGYLFPMELKSTKAKSISFSESMIKKNQIKNLHESLKYEGVIAGFLFNFREPENRTFFVHISDFVKYKNIAENQLEHTYKCREGKKINRASISMDICEEIGVEVTSVKKQVNYRYYINELVDELIQKYG